MQHFAEVLLPKEHREAQESQNPGSGLEETLKLIFWSPWHWREALGVAVPTLK